MIPKRLSAHYFLSLSALAVLLGGCAAREEILPGARFDVASEAVVSAVVNNNEAPNFIMPRQERNVLWSSQLAGRHFALGTQLAPIWSTKIGQGNSRRNRVQAAPIFADEKIFAFDASAQLSALSETGQVLWQKDLTPERERRGEASGTGLTFGAGRLFATTSFGEVYALDPVSGNEIWRQELDAALVSAPSYHDGVVYLLAGNKVAWAIEAKNGRIRWQLDGGARVNSVSQGAAPYVDNKLALFAYGGGEIEAVFRQGGGAFWNRVLTGGKSLRAFGSISDIPQTPAVLGGVAYVSNITGRLGAYALENGEQLWSANIASQGRILPVANALFLVSDRNQLVRLDRQTGTVIWARSLPFYVDRKAKNRSDIVIHYGPILAGGRLILGSSDGVLRSFDPQNGAELPSFDLGDGAGQSLVIAKETLYVLADSGHMRAYR